MGLKPNGIWIHYLGMVAVISLGGGIVSFFSWIPTVNNLFPKGSNYLQLWLWVSLGFIIFGVVLGVIWSSLVHLPVPNDISLGKGLWVKTENLQPIKGYYNYYKTERGKIIWIDECLLYGKVVDQLPEKPSLVQAQKLIREGDVKGARALVDGLVDSCEVY